MCGRKKEQEHEVGWLGRWREPRKSWGGENIIKLYCMKKKSVKIAKKINVTFAYLILLRKATEK